MAAALSCASVRNGSSTDAGTDTATDIAPADRALATETDGASDSSPPPAPPAGFPELACSDKALGNAGCSFYSVEPPTLTSSRGRCHVMFVVNPGNKAATLTLINGGATYSLARVARTPRGAGSGLRYEAFDPAAGLAPGQVVIVFLAGKKADPTLGSDLQPGFGCPDGVEAALPDGGSPGLPLPTPVGRVHSNRGTAFHLTADRPVVAYDMNPFSLASSYVPSASLLIPEGVWSTSNIAATPTRTYTGFISSVVDENAATYVMVLAAHDQTHVSVRPSGAVEAAGGVPGGKAGETVRFTLNAGEFAQLSEGTADQVGAGLSTGLGGTLVAADKPVLTVGGIPCTYLPIREGACDSSHQQIPPLSAWGHAYAAVGYRSRLITDEPIPWLVVGGANDTVLTYGPKPPTPFADYPTPAPTRLNAGQVVQFWTADPFVVRSQDTAHPFYLAAQMTGGTYLNDQRTPENQGAGDPDFVNVTPLEQYLNDYTFFTDPTYSETNLVLIRKPGTDGRFADVRLTCASAPVTGWTDLGDVQFARVDLVTGYFKPVVPGCNNGVNRVTSAAPFGLTVWGWGTRLKGAAPGEIPMDLGATSYGYPAGAGLGVVNVARPLVIP